LNLPAFYPIPFLRAVLLDLRAFRRFSITASPFWRFGFRRPFMRSGSDILL
jgi:hypothetical protein